MVSVSSSINCLNSSKNKIVIIPPNKFKNILKKATILVSLLELTETINPVTQVPILDPKTKQIAVFKLIIFEESKFWIIITTTEDDCIMAVTSVEARIAFVGVSERAKKLIRRLEFLKFKKLISINSIDKKSIDKITSIKDIFLFLNI